MGDAAYPEAISHEDTAEAVGKETSSGGFRNPLGRLRTLGLIEYPERRMARAAGYRRFRVGRVPKVGAAICAAVSATRARAL